MGPRELLLASAAVAVVLFGLLAGPPEQRVLDVGPNGTTAIATVHLQEVVEDGRDPLAPAERDSIRTVAARERATAALFADRSGDHPAIARLAPAERSHADAAGILLEKYDLADRTTNGSAGRGLSAVAAAVEQDIATLRAERRRTDNQDVKRVYDVLAVAARNHLRHLDAAMHRENVSYGPRHLDAARYQQIVDGAVERRP